MPPAWRRKTQSVNKRTYRSRRRAEYPSLRRHDPDQVL